MTYTAVPTVGAICGRLFFRKKRSPTAPSTTARPVPTTANWGTVAVTVSDAISVYEPPHFISVPTWEHA